jgi:hypothetical protein
MDLVRAFNESGLFAKMSLIVGFVPLLVAILYVRRPTERVLAFMRPVSLTAIFGALSGLAVGLIAVLHGLAASADPGWPLVFLGVSEALVPAFLNFGLLAVSWLLIAAGMLRRTP